MTLHLSSEHYWQIEHDGMEFLCCVTEHDGHFWCGKIRAKDHIGFAKFGKKLKDKWKEAVTRKALEYSKMARRGEWKNEEVKPVKTNIL